MTEGDMIDIIELLNQAITMRTLVSPDAAFLIHGIEVSSEIARCWVEKHGTWRSSDEEIDWIMEQVDNDAEKD